MTMFKVLAAFLLALSVTSQATAGNIDPARGLYIEGPISRGSMAPVKKALDELIADEKSSQPITIVLDSPGGEVISGMSFVSSMRSAKARGIQIDCYVTGLAASMAFLILTECDHRMYLDTSFLLWHGVRTGTNQPITALLAKQLHADLARFDELAMSMLAELDMSSSEIQHHFDVETLWSGMSLDIAAPRFGSAHKAFPDVVRALPKFKARSSSFNIMDLFGGKLILISPKVWTEMVDESEAGE